MTTVENFARRHRQTILGLLALRQAVPPPAIGHNRPGFRPDVPGINPDRHFSS
jgi:hypothetical protein